MKVAEYMGRKLTEEEVFFYDFMEKDGSAQNVPDDVVERLQSAMHDEFDSYIVAAVNENNKTVDIISIVSMEDDESPSGVSFNFDERIIDEVGSRWIQGACLWGYASAFDLINDECLGEEPSSYKYYEISDVYDDIEKMNDDQTYDAFMESIKELPEMEVNRIEWKAYHAVDIMSDGGMVAVVYEGFGDEAYEKCMAILNITGTTRRPDGKWLEYTRMEAM